MGVNIEAVSSFTMTNCITADVSERLNEAIHLSDKQAAFAICSYVGNDKCSDLNI